MKIKILIVEDEFIIADYMQDCLQKLGYEVVGTCLNYEEAIAALEIQKPDIALIDITLKGKKNGIDLAHYIKQYYNLPFIFATSHSDKGTIDKAKQALPYAYLIKPFSEEDLYAVIETALMHFGRQQQKEIEQTEESPIIINDGIFIKHKSKFVKLKVEEIIYIEASDNYAVLFTASTSYVLKTTLKHLLDALPDFFWRIHRSYIINLHHLISFDLEELTVSTKTLPVGKSFYPMLIDKLKIVQG